MPHHLATVLQSFTVTITLNLKMKILIHLITILIMCVNYHTNNIRTFMAVLHMRGARHDSESC